MHGKGNQQNDSFHSKRGTLANEIIRKGLMELIVLTLIIIYLIVKEDNKKDWTLTIYFSSLKNLSKSKKRCLTASNFWTVSKV